MFWAPFCSRDHYIDAIMMGCDLQDKIALKGALRTGLWIPRSPTLGEISLVFTDARKQRLEASFF